MRFYALIEVLLEDFPEEINSLVQDPVHWTMWSVATGLYLHTEETVVPEIEDIKQGVKYPLKLQFLKVRSLRIFPLFHFQSDLTIIFLNLKGGCFCSR